MITREDVLKRFEYRNDGHLYRRDNSGQARAGDQLGTIRKSNGNYYRKAVINGVVMSVHRLIFLMHHNTVPASIDHINGDSLDNRIENLRAATHSQNSANKKTPKNNTSGFKGVYYDKTRNRWEASIMVRGKREKLGRYKTPQEAAIAYRDAAVQHFGDFARFDSPGDGMIDDTKKELND